MFEWGGYMGLGGLLWDMRISVFDYRGPLGVCFCIQDCGCDFIGVCSACILEQEGSGHTGLCL